MLLLKRLALFGKNELYWEVWFVIAPLNSDFSVSICSGSRTFRVLSLVICPVGRQVLEWPPSSKLKKIRMGIQNRHTSYPWSYPMAWTSELALMIPGSILPTTTPWRVDTTALGKSSMWFSYKLMFFLQDDEVTSNFVALASPWLELCKDFLS